MARPIRQFTKPAIDFPQQLQKLQGRGLVVADEPRALRYLANISYYNPSCGLCAGLVQGVSKNEEGNF